MHAGGRTTQWLGQDFIRNHALKPACIQRGGIPFSDCLNAGSEIGLISVLLFSAICLSRQV